MWWKYVLFILGYLILGIVTAILVDKEMCGRDKEEAIAAGFIWPFVWIVFAAGMICYICFALPSEKIADWWDKKQKNK